MAQPQKLTFADHAEAWIRDQIRKVPERGTEEWESLYEEWVAFAFKDCWA